MPTETIVEKCLNPLPYNQNIKSFVAELNAIKNSINKISNAAGTVKQVGFAAPTDVFTVVGSPITSAGTIVLDFLTQAKNTFLATPNIDGTPYFRTISLKDIGYLLKNLQRAECLILLDI